MSQDEGNAWFSAEIGEPLPGEDTFNGHHEPLTIGGGSPEEGVWSGFHLAVQHDFPIVAQDADVHGTGMQVDSAVKLMLIGVESHEVSSIIVNLFSTTSIPPGYAEGEASYIINRLQPTASSVRSYLASASGSG